MVMSFWESESGRREHKPYHHTIIHHTDYRISKRHKNDGYSANVFAFLHFYTPFIITDNVLLRSPGSVVEQSVFPGSPPPGDVAKHRRLRYYFEYEYAVVNAYQAYDRCPSAAKSLSQLHLYDTYVSSVLVLSYLIIVSKHNPIERMVHGHSCAILV